VDIFDEEILNFWKALQENSVQYILVGDYAMNLHGYKYFSIKLDICLTI